MPWSRTKRFYEVSPPKIGRGQFFPTIVSIRSITVYSLSVPRSSHFPFIFVENTAFDIFDGFSLTKKAKTFLQIRCRWAKRVHLHRLCAAYYDPQQAKHQA